MEMVGQNAKGSVKRLLVPLGLLALYPLAIVVLQLAQAPAPGKVAVELTLSAGGTDGAVMGLDVLARNRESEPIELTMLMINLIRNEQPERSLIEDRPALARRLGGEPVLEADSAADLGRFVLGPEGPPSGDTVIQVSLNVRDPSTGEPRQITLERSWAEIAASD